MQGNGNRNNNWQNGGMRLKDIMDRSRKPEGQNNKGIFDRLLQKLGDWTKDIAAKLAGSKDSGKAPAAAPQPDEDRMEVTIGGEAENAELPEGDMLSVERRRIAEWLTSARFRTKLFMGVDEADVWKKIRQLNKMYDDALLAERARYDALLQHYMETLGGTDYSGDYYADEYDDSGEYGYPDEDGMYAEELEDDTDYPDSEEEYEDSDEDEYSGDW